MNGAHFRVNPFSQPRNVNGLKWTNISDHTQFVVLNLPNTSGRTSIIMPAGSYRVDSLSKPVRLTDYGPSTKSASTTDYRLTATHNPKLDISFNCWGIRMYHSWLADLLMWNDKMNNLVNSQNWRVIPIGIGDFRLNFNYYSTVD